jgi:hypothetical protein
MFVLPSWQVLAMTFMLELEQEVRVGWLRFSSYQAC